MSWNEVLLEKCSTVLCGLPVLLDIFFDASFGFNEREGRFAIAFGRHGDRQPVSLSHTDTHAHLSTRVVIQRIYDKRKKDGQLDDDFRDEQVRPPFWVISFI